MTNIKRKITLAICLALSLVMLFVLSSCDIGETPSNNSTSTDTNTDSNEFEFIYRTDGEVENGVIITGYKGEIPKELVIPAEVDGYMVSGVDGFQGVDIESLIISENVGYIYGGAFNNCTSLKKLSLPNQGGGLYDEHYFGYKSFENCSIEELTCNASVFSMEERPTFSENVKKLTIRAGCIDMSTGIKYCSSIEEIYFDEGAEGVSDEALYGMKSLKSVICHENCKIYFGWNSLSSCENLSTLVLPKNGARISEYAFANCAIKELILPEGVTNIDGDAFYGCANLTIYCEATSKPSGWSLNWNSSNCPVYWYSESEPTIDGNYWHYGDNEIVIWDTANN